MTEPRNVVFVFGSNREGRHGKGAALHAMKEWGAIYGRAEGRQGDAYAIITKELRPDHPPVLLGEVQIGVRSFLSHALAHPDTRFKVTAIGCGLAGFTPEQIAPLFKRGSWTNKVLSNVILPKVFKDVLKGMPVEEPQPYPPIAPWPSAQYSPPMGGDALHNYVHVGSPIVLPDAPPGELAFYQAQYSPYLTGSGDNPPVQASPEFRRLITALQQPMPVWGDVRCPNDDVFEDGER